MRLGKSPYDRIIDAAVALEVADRKYQEGDRGVGEDDWLEAAMARLAAIRELNQAVKDLHKELREQV